MSRTGSVEGEVSAKIVVTHQKINEGVNGDVLVDLVTDLGTWRLRQFSYGVPYVYKGHDDNEVRRAMRFASAVMDSLQRVEPQVVFQEKEPLPYYADPPG